LEYKAKMKNKVLIIGQNYSTSYGVIRALGEAGYRCEVGKRICNKIPRFLTPELKSKYVDKYAYLMTDDDSSMIHCIISNFAIEGERKVLIPTDDFCVALVDRNLKILQKYFYLPNINGKQGEMSKMTDKLYQKEIIRQYDIQTADICVINRKTDIDTTILENISYPCFIKPLSSVGNPKYLIQKCSSYEELVSGLTGAFNDRGCKMLVEKFIEVETEYTIPGIAIDGNVLIPSLLEKTEIGSGSHKGVTISGVVHSSEKFDELVRKLKRFVKDIGLTGIFDIEVLYSKGDYYFNELNLRYGAAGYALTGSGINLPEYYVESLQNGKPINNTKVQFKEGLTFVNEKAAFEYYMAGYSRFFVFLRILKKADIRFIITGNDVMVAFSFFRLIMMSILLKFVNKFRQK